MLIYWSFLILNTHHCSCLIPTISIGEILKSHSNFQPSLPGPADQGVRPPSRLALRPWRKWTAHGFWGSVRDIEMDVYNVYLVGDIWFIGDRYIYISIVNGVLKANVGGSLCLYPLVN